MEDFLSSVWEPFDGGRTFRLDAEEEKDKYIVRADLPGVKRDQIDVSLENNNLTISVKREEIHEEEGRNFLRRERRSGSASRTVHLPLAAEGEKTDARFQDGVLEITVPKSEQAKAKRIEVH